MKQWQGMFLHPVLMVHRHTMRMSHRSTVALLSLIVLTSCGTNTTAIETEVLPIERGNAGMSCTQDRDCITPTDYQIRSSCPFTSKCIENTCAVVCPMWKDDPNPDVNGSYTVACTQDSDCDCSRYAVPDMIRCTCAGNMCVAIVKE